MAFRVFDPFRKMMARSSSLLRALGPCLSKRSRGRIVRGQCAMDDRFSESLATIAL